MATMPESGGPPTTLEIQLHWSSPMRFGDACDFAAMCRDLDSLSEVDYNGFSEYLKGMGYQEFLSTRYWYAIRLKIRSLQKSCQCCTAEADVFQIHHRTYEHHGYEHKNLEDLRLLCFRCHSIVSETAALVISQIKLRGIDGL